MAEGTVSPHLDDSADSDRARRPALSPSRAGDFKQCPLLYRFRAIDKLPETPTQAQVRGTLVHSVLERLFALTRAQRTREQARDLVAPTWEELSQDRPDWADLFSDETGQTSEEPTSSGIRLLNSYFGLEDPQRLEPESCELRLETELSSGVRLRGYIDRVDVAPTGEIRVVDYKTGASPRQLGEAKALFQMKFYAVMIWRSRGVVPHQLKLLYLKDGQELVYTPDEPELARFERTIEAIWNAIRRAARSGDFRPNPSKLCGWCPHQNLCPEFGGTPPAYPGDPEPDSGEEPVLESPS